MNLTRFHLKKTATNAYTCCRFLPNRWDLIAFLLIISVFAMVISALHEMMAPIDVLHAKKISLDILNLPEYALRTTVRLLAAIVISIVFTIIYGTFAAKSRRARKILILILDILQSVPILGYISFTVPFFLALVPDHVLGPELSAIFAIFTSQAWNITFSFYQSLRTIPRDLDEVSNSLHLTLWQRFWKLEIPFSIPGLVWNIVMSMSGGWFFVVASEAVSVDNKIIILPGIGSYLAQAISDKNLGAIGWAILTMTIVIFLHDQIIFRPLLAWSDKFRVENTSIGSAPKSYILDLVRRTHLIRCIFIPVCSFFKKAACIRIQLRHSRLIHSFFLLLRNQKISRVIDIIWATIVIIGTIDFVYYSINYLVIGVTFSDICQVFTLGLITLIRVIVLIIIVSVIWVPIGVWIGLNPSLAEKLQPIVQFLAAFPSNLLFPLFVVIIEREHLNADIWLSPLIILGAQWYILFNVIAGAVSYPNDYREAATNFRIHGWQWWQKVMLPGIFPYYITGAITASGGAWNASIVSEFVQWGNIKIEAHGLGAYMSKMTIAGDYPKIILSIIVMSLFVTFFNRLLWRPLYTYAEENLRLD
ncbi:MAG: ABC transporter permease subunit [Burkholderia sp.]|nr:ABC transporter permease subunit [Burkholderia sp.]